MPSEADLIEVDEADITEGTEAQIINEVRTASPTPKHDPMLTIAKEYKIWKKKRVFSFLPKKFSQ